MKKKINNSFDIDNYVTHSDQWSYLKVNYIYKKLYSKIKDLLENFFSIKILKKKNYNLQEDRISYLVSSNLKKRKILLLSKTLIPFLKKLKIYRNKSKLIKNIIDHEKIFYRNPIINNYGGIGFNNSLIMFLFFKEIKVDAIIESGVWKGYISYLVDQIFKTNKVNKFKFDINFKNILYYSKSSKYCEHDIEEYNFNSKKLNLKKSCFIFDDHVSQLNRFEFCDNLKVGFIVFDDDINFETVHSDGWPAIPTISMIKDKFFLKKIKWINSGRVAKANFSHNFNKKKLNNYLIVKAPNLSFITGYYVQSPMTFLIRVK